MDEIKRETIDEAMIRLERRRDSGNLRAYYFEFSPTGNPDIDLILAAVAAAGKGYHHTESWCDADHGPSYAELIQEAASRAAAKRSAVARKRSGS